jgi:Doublecortin
VLNKFQVTLPHGVRCIFALDGKSVENVDELQHGSNYVCSSTAVFKKIDYLKMAQEQDQNHWNTIKRETCYLSKLIISWFISVACTINI